MALEVIESAPSSPSLIQIVIWIYNACCLKNYHSDYYETSDAYETADKKTEHVL